jgi:hypothetical protein
VHFRRCLLLQTAVCAVPDSFDGPKPVRSSYRGVLRAEPTKAVAGGEASRDGRGTMSIDNIGPQRLPVEAERARAEAERLRQLAEETRAAREDARDLGEVGRVAAEDRRAEAESLRVAAVDGLRDTADLLRVTLDKMKAVEEMRRQSRAPGTSNSS